MTAITHAQPFASRAARPNSFDISPATRTLIGMVGVGFTALSAVALVRLGAGYAPAHSGLKDVAVLFHVASVVPAVPLGAWLMLARKGTPRHKSLGKVWVVLMVLTALSALFIRTANGGEFSFIHLFVPLTLHGAWKTVSTARKGNIPAHKRALVQMYLGALIIPGLFAFLPDRMMGMGLFG